MFLLLMSKRNEKVNSSKGLVIVLCCCCFFCSVLVCLIKSNECHHANIWAIKKVKENGKHKPKIIK